jgi:predicted membrane protein
VTEVTVVVSACIALLDSGDDYYYYYYYYYLYELTNRMSQLQVNQVKDIAKKKETKRSNHQTFIKNQQNYSNPYQATSILLQVSNERVKSNLGQQI